MAINARVLYVSGNEGQKYRFYKNCILSRAIIGLETIIRILLYFCSYIHTQKKIMNSSKRNYLVVIGLLKIK